MTGQTIDGDMAELPHLRIGGLSLPRWRVAFADLHTFALWDPTSASRDPDRSGCPLAVRKGRLSDFAHNEVSFRLPDMGNVRQVHA